MYVTVSYIQQDYVSLGPLLPLAIREASLTSNLVPPTLLQQYEWYRFSDTVAAVVKAPVRATAETGAGPENCRSEACEPSRLRY
jgi:hypothetical protein